MRMRYAAIGGAALALSLATPATAGTLCRDSKGLFTPCTGMPARAAQPAHHRRDAGSGPARSMPEKAGTAGGKPANGAPSTPAKPPLVGRAKLCRDSKGLFKPC